MPLLKPPDSREKRGREKKEGRRRKKEVKKKAKEKLLKKFLFESLQNVSLAVGGESLTRFSPDVPCKTFGNRFLLKILFQYFFP
ncbi:MAG: hypothetical protein BWY28_02806 [bacterium ADurb.Bin236]|nr:MAG: hypothetical protein BWY28_02806 [bacterium ADurb.Bin236]